ncbi:esterase, partial [bacterium]|nr:esterase [bacterium]
MARGEVTVLNFESELLKKNPLGDPALREIPVYLPPHYAASADRRFPVVYVLVGFTGTGRMLLNVPPFDEALAPDRLDRLIAEGMPPVIAVFPDCSTKYGGSQFLDSPATGDYMSHIVKELVPEVDRRFRTIPDRDARAVLGKSSGGYGALILAMEHPQVFSGCGSHSGDCYFEHCYGQDFPKFVRDVRKRGGLEKFLREFPKLEVKDKDDGFLVNVVAMAQAYSPNPERGLPVNFDLPFDMETGELKPWIFTRWKLWDPVERAGLRVDALSSLRAL